MKKQIRTFSSDCELIKNRRQQIISHAAKLFVRGGYGTTSVQQLAESLGMSKAGLYHYIGSKDDIALLIIESSFSWGKQIRGKILKEINGHDAEESLSKALKISFEEADKVQDIYNFNNHIIASCPPELRKRMFESENEWEKFFESLLLKGIESGEFEPDNPRLTAENIVILINAWANRRWFLRKHVTLEEYILKQTELILRGLRVNNSNLASSSKQLKG